MNVVAVASGTTEVLRGERIEANAGEGRSTGDLRDLRALKAWLGTQPTSNTTKVVEAYVDIAINHLASQPGKELDACREPWSRIQGLFRTAKDPVGPTALSQFVKMDVIRRWFDARASDYTQYCQASNSRTLSFFEHSGKPLLYGFVRPDEHEEAKPFVIEGAVMRWRREIVPPTQIMPFWRLIYPDGKYVVEGWRYWVVTISTIFQIVIMGFAFLLGIASAISIPLTGAPAVYSFLLMLFVIGSIYHWSIKPALREFDLRTSPARLGTTMRGGPAWIDRINANLGRDKTDPDYKAENKVYRQLVRWKADCPICGSPIELKMDSPVAKGLVGCCVESPDEHSFTFDRVTLEGRPLRAKPRSTNPGIKQEQHA